MEKIIHYAHMLGNRNITIFRLEGVVFVSAIICFSFLGKVVYCWIRVIPVRPLHTLLSAGTVVNEC